MNLISDEIVTLLRSHDFGYPNLTVERSFDAEIKTFPRIIVRQLTEVTLINTVDEQKVSGIAFQFEIYCQDCVNSKGNVVGRVEACDDITEQIDALMWKNYKFNRDDVTEIARYSIDIAYRYLRYSGAIEDGYVYRSSSVPYRGYTYQNNY
mgnify:CR=1 FL=1